jgi:hypothetical protein
MHLQRYTPIPFHSRGNSGGAEVDVSILHSNHVSTPIVRSYWSNWSIGALLSSIGIARGRGEGLLPRQRYLLLEADGQMDARMPSRSFIL